MGPYPEAEFPCRNTHPVILAKCMLSFALALQNPRKDNHGLSEPQGTIMSRLISAATTWVTTKQEMQGSIDCLICIMFEGIFETNVGNLRRAWVVYRRAMTVAQLMGLHRSPFPPLKRIDTSIKVSPEILWFRIVYMDRYLSLLLGLPQGTTDKSMGAISILQNETPLGRFERSLTIIASRILEHNEGSLTQSEPMVIQSIDSELLKASRCMPASFWRPANFENLSPGDPGACVESLRLGAQVYYFDLLIQLHLPYMMRIGNNTVNEYSKTTCVNASREVLTRFIAHRSFSPWLSCSRPMDFFALLAAMTLLLAHLDAQHHLDAANPLSHQRLSDRAMLDQVLERMDAISSVNGDSITGLSAKLLRRLLDIEADAAQGGSYTTTTKSVDHEAKGKEEELLLHIPYLGTIKIARQCLKSRGIEANRDSQHLQSLSPKLNDRSENMLPIEPSQLQETRGYELCMLQYPSSAHDNMVQPHMELPPITAGVDDWTFQGVDMAFFDSLMRGTSSMCNDGLEQ
jgi:hypothetical protein